MASMAINGNPFASDAAILPTDPSTTPGTPSLLEMKEKEGDPGKPEEPAPTRSFFGWKSAKPRTQADPEQDMEKKRPTKLIAPIYNGLGAALALCAYHPCTLFNLPLTRYSKVFMGSGLRMLLMEFFLDGDYVRFALVVTMPFLFCVSLVSSTPPQSHGTLLTDVQFFSISVIGNISMVVGPVAQFHENSKYYSAIKPKPNKAVDARLPHVTIQMPVYKESLTETM